MPNLQDVLTRLGLAFFAGMIVGLDRETHGRAAGLRTTILVCLASTVTMLLAEQLGGGVLKADYARFSQGILTGMGFLGAGCIIKEGSMVRGVTTAAMLWFVAILGLAFGCGELDLGLIGLAAGLVTLVLMPRVEDRFKNDWYVRVQLTLDLAGPSENELRAQLEKLGPHVKNLDLDYDRSANQRTVIFELRVRHADVFVYAQKVVHHFTAMPGVKRVQWGER